MGRNCVEHYSTLHRYCVFAHDELVCKMSTEAEKLTLLVAMATYQDLLTMLEAERGINKITIIIINRQPNKNVLKLKLL